MAYHCEPTEEHEDKDNIPGFLNLVEIPVVLNDMLDQMEQFRIRLARLSITVSSLKKTLDLYRSDHIRDVKHSEDMREGQLGGTD